MEAIKILDKKENLSWDYDEEADVLYISIGEPRKALGVDIGEGAIVKVCRRNKGSRRVNPYRCKRAIAQQS